MLNYLTMYCYMSQSIIYRNVYVRFSFFDRPKYRREVIEPYLHIQLLKVAGVNLDERDIRSLLMLS